MATDGPPIPAPRRRRRWRRLWPLLLLVPALLVAAVPWALNSGAGRRWLLARANRAMAPGAIEATSIRFSWLSPTELIGFALIDPQGDRVVEAPRATWSPSLGQTLLGPAARGTLTLHEARFDVERAADGSIDLAQALKPILSTRNPTADLAVVVRYGTLRLRTPDLARPIEASPAALHLRIPPRPGRLTWRVTLEEPGEETTGKLVAVGSFDRWADDPGLPGEQLLFLTAESWPLALGGAGIDSAGRFTVRAQGSRRRGQWWTTGRASAADWQVAGPSLAGDRLVLDDSTASWDTGQGPTGWTIAGLDLSSPIGTVKATRVDLESAEPTGSIHGALDLVALARQIPHRLGLRDGLAIDRGLLEVDLTTAPDDQGRPGWLAEARLDELSGSIDGRPVRLRAPAKGTVAVRIDGDRPIVDRLAIESTILKAQGSGDPRSGIALDGTIDLTALRDQAAEFVDLGGLELSGHGRFRAEYTAPADRPYAASFRLDATDPRLVPAGGLALSVPELTIDATLTGPTTAQGLPAGWSTARSVGRADAADFVVEVARQADRATATLSLAGPVAIGDRTGRAAATAAIRWDRRSPARLAIDDLAIQLDSPAGVADMVATSIEGVGLLDLDAGTLAIDARPDASPTALAFGPDGLRVRWNPEANEPWIADLDLRGSIRPAVTVATAWGRSLPASGLAGDWRSALRISGDATGADLGARANLADLAWDSGAGRGSSGPIAASLRARWDRATDRLELGGLTVSSAGLDLTATGAIAELSGRRRLDLDGTIATDWERISAAMAERVEPGAWVRGGPIAFAAHGSLGADGSADPAPTPLVATLRADLAGAEAYGMRLGPTTIAARWEQGRIDLAPIDADLNGGRLHLEPSIESVAGRPPTLVLGPGSRLENAEINDDVSRRVLTFAAPVLENSTKVRGRVSANIERAAFPLGTRPADPAPGEGLSVEGQVLFHDVEFAPGPLATDLLGLIGRQDAALRLDRPVLLTIDGDGIDQVGPSIPVGDLARIEFEGHVGFDRSLDLTASLPLNPALGARDGLVGALALGRPLVRIPIGGTIDEPKVDMDALGAHFKEMGVDLLTRVVPAGAAGLLERLTRPRDPNAPPPPTAAERRALRLQKKAERQARRQQNR